MNELVCITGLTGSGKSVASDFFIAKGFQYLRFGQVVLDKVMELKMEVNEMNERKVREDLRKKFGMAAMATLNLEKLKSLLKKGNVIGDGLYSFEEYKVLKKEFGKQFVTLAVYSSPEVRYGRLDGRKLTAEDKSARNRPLTSKEAKSRDYAELENLNKGATIAMADYTILNTKDLVYFNNQLNETFNEIQIKK